MTLNFRKSETHGAHNNGIGEINNRLEESQASPEAFYACVTTSLYQKTLQGTVMIQTTGGKGRSYITSW